MNRVEVNNVEVVRPLLVTGSARSGTKYISEVMKAADFDFSHEKDAPFGSSCCLCSRHFQVESDFRFYSFFPVGFRRIEVGATFIFNYEHVFHQVRNPLSAIASRAVTFLQEDKQWLHSAGIADRGVKILHRAALYWVYANKKSEEISEWRYKVEDLPAVWPEFLHRLGVNKDNHKFPEYVKTMANHGTGVRKTPRITLAHIEKYDEMLAKTVDKMAGKYGYHIR